MGDITVAEGERIKENFFRPASSSWLGRLKRLGVSESGSSNVVRRKEDKNTTLVLHENHQQVHILIQLMETNGSRN